MSSRTTEPHGLLGALPHDADIGVGGAGPTKAEDVRQAGPALTAVVTDPGNVAPFMRCPCDAKRRPTNCSSWKWLNALIADIAVRAMLFSNCAIEIDGDEQRATAYGEAVEISRHEPAVEICFRPGIGLIARLDVAVVPVRLEGVDRMIYRTWHMTCRQSRSIQLVA